MPIGYQSGWWPLAKSARLGVAMAVAVALVAAITLTVALATLLRESCSALDFPDTHLTSNWHRSTSLIQRHSLELVSADLAQCTSRLVVCVKWHGELRIGH